MGVVAGSIDPADVVVKSLVGGATLTATTVTTTPPTGTTNPVTATFTFNAPGGIWNSTDTDIYRVWLVGTVLDNASNPVVAPVELTSFSAKLGGKSLSVTQPGDNDDGDYTAGNLTLREAINFSNAVTGSVETITFGLAAGTTIPFTSVNVISDTVEISHPGNPSDITISGDSSVQLFTLAGSGTSVTMSGLTLTNGKATNGGAFQLTTQTLSLNNMVLTTNSSTAGGGAIYASSTATVNVVNSRLSSNGGTTGGAIYLSAGTLTVDKSLVTSNQGTAGGAIFLASSTGTTLNVISSQFQSNNASGTSATFNGGGAIFLAANAQNLNITDSTFANNTSAHRRRHHQCAESGQRHHQAIDFQC